MQTQSTRPATALQGPFDAIPVMIQQRPDLGSGPKRLYAALCSAQRMGWRPSYAELAGRLACSSRSIVRWVARLAAAGLIAVRRRGQGLSNFITVLGLVTSGGEKLPRAGVTGWQPGRRDTFSKEKKGRQNRDRTIEDYTSGPYGRLVRRA